jgi:hypothetical protein
MGSVRSRLLDAGNFLESLGAMPDEAVGLRSMQLSPDELALLLEALDSHEYWQMGELLPHNDGMVWIPGDCVGSFDRYWQDGGPTDEQADAIEQVQRCRELAARVRLALVQG